MIKETRSLIRLLRASLHKGVTHQWFLNQYVKKHKMESLVIFNKTIEYDHSKRIISFKQNSRSPAKKPISQQYNLETATFVLLKDISQVGGGWLGTIVICSSCVNALHSSWVTPDINFASLQTLLNTILDDKLSSSCFCGQGQRKLLTACKPLFVTHTHKNTEYIFGLVSNSFLVPKILYQINKLVYTSAEEFKLLVRDAQTLAGLPGTPDVPPILVPRRNTKVSNHTSPLFVTLLQLMFFWLKTGPRSTQKLFQYYILDDLKRIK